MANFSNYLENAIVSWLNGTTMPAATGSLWVALYSSPGVVQNDAATNLIGTRVEVSNWSVTTATGSSDSSSDASIKNGAEIVMISNSNITATASHFAVYDAASTGNLLFHGQLTGSIAIVAGDTVKFAPEAITLTVQ
jgi:hypothetical protein